MEFTVGRRLRRRGLSFLAAGLAGVAAISGWIAVEGMPSAHAEPALGLCFFGLSGWLGGRELLRARRPFRLRVDSFGLTTHDMELSWRQIDAVALRYPPDFGDGEGSPPKPLLVVRPAPGVRVPRSPDLRFDDRVPRYTLVDTEDLDQRVGELAAALAEFAGARFEAAARPVRRAAPAPAPVPAPLPVPAAVAAAERESPGAAPERVFLAPGTHGRWTLLWLAAALVCTAPPVDFLATQGRRGSAVYLGPWFLGSLASWWLTARQDRRRRRPLRLRIGPAGIAMRELAEAEHQLPWPEIATVAVGPLPPTADPRPWLIVWPLPGTPLAATGTHVLDGRQACALVRLDRLPGGEAAVAPAVRSYAGERFSG